MKVTRFFSFAAIVLMCFFSSCEKEKKDGSLTLQFKAKYGDQNFALNAANTDPYGRLVKLDELKFYLSHITLIKEDNSETELKDVALINFQNPNSLIYDFNNIKGDFKGIKFGNGIDSIQNLTDPNSITDENNPLGDQLMYWGWLKYLFQVVQVKCDTTGNGSGTYNWSASYHIGTNPAYRQTQLLKNFSVCCETKSTVTIWLDVKKIFYGNTKTLDIITQRTTQMGSGDDPEIANTFVTNFSQAFEVE